jgi:hypothetical protein
LLGVGFEPTQISLRELKSPALDRSAIPACVRVLASFTIYTEDTSFKPCQRREFNLAIN